ncbi:MAG: aminopeptidase P family protein [Rhodospirillales bacterium]|nr:aminopeptidase P family protein [Rhodospirillales bacterium]
MDETEGVSVHASRLAALRVWLRERELGGCLVPRSDEHLGEYVPPSAERLAWLSGFTGSAGLAVVLADRAVLFTDGRYTLQAAAETDPALWERRHSQEEPPERWLGSAAPGARIGYDPMLISETALARFAKVGLEMVAMASPGTGESGGEANPIDLLWADRPPPPRTLSHAHPLSFAGEDSAAKRARLGGLLAAAGEDAAVLSDPASINWLLNIRGRDLEFTPVALGFALLFADGRVSLFMEGEKLPPETRAWLGPEVVITEPATLGAALAEFKGRRVRVDPVAAPVWFATALRAAGATVSAGPDPCRLPKACKNATEQAGARAAQRRDAAAMARFLAWLARAGATGRETECSAAAELLRLRRALPGFAGESFPAISSAGEHGAIIHYRASPASDRPIRPNEVYLIDSGAQFPEGTTDVTRTVWIGPAAPPAVLTEQFTRVLAGHIALATLQFPHGTTGPALDAIARRPLWDAGLDYDHGTGHGVGSFLSVHEGPAGISRHAEAVTLEPGMILSDEPGFYLPGAYGIRIENLLLVRTVEAGRAGKPFLAFETLTLVPFARRLIRPKLLGAAQVAWLNDYHARVRDDIGPALEPDERAWLETESALFG